MDQIETAASAPSWQDAYNASLRRPTTQPTPEGSDGGSPGLTDYLTDIPKGVGAGVVGLGLSLGSLANDIYGSLGGDKADESWFENPIKTRTWLGGLVSGATQFSLAFIPAGAAIDGLGLLSKVGTGAKIARGLAAGAAANFLAFDGHQARLSNLIEQFPALHNPITGFLAAKTDDNWAEGRLKNSLEGMGLGAATDGLIASLKGFKAMSAAKVANDPEAFAKASQQASEEVQNSVPRSTQDIPFEGSVTPVLSKTAEEKAAVPPTGDIPEDVKAKVSDYIAQSIDKGAPLDEAVQGALDNHINFNKLDLTADVHTLLDNVGKIVEPYMQTQGGKRQAILTAVETAQELGKDPVKLFGSMSEDANWIKDLGPRLLAYKAVRNSLGNNLTIAIRKASDELRGGAEISEATQEDARQTLKAFMPVYKFTRQVQTGVGRALSFQQATVGGTTGDLSRLYNYLDGVLQSGGKTGDDLINSLVTAQGDPSIITQAVRSFEDRLQPWWNKAMAANLQVWMNSVVSGVHTVSAIVTSQAVQSALLPAERFIGGVVMKASGQAGADAAMASAGNLYVGWLGALKDIFTVADRSQLLTEDTAVTSAYKTFLNNGEGRVASAEWSARPNAISPEALNLDPNSFVGKFAYSLGRFVNLPLRTHAAITDFMNFGNARSWLYAKGVEEGTAQGLKGEELNTFVQQFARNAFNSDGALINRGALDYAQMGSFSKQLDPKSLSGGLSRLLNEHPNWKMVLPFIQTPTNIFTRAVQYTPGLDFLNKEFRSMISSPDPLIRSQAYGRAAIGGAFWSLFSGLAMSGKLTGSGPANPEERQSLLATGWQPYSFKLQNDDGTTSYVNYQRLEPFGMILGLAADYSDIGANLHDDDRQGVASAMLASLAKNLANRSYLVSLTQFANAATQPDRFVKSFLEQRIASYVPNLVAQVNPDDNMREVRDWMDAVKRRLPGFSEDLPPRRNLVGEPITPHGGWLPFGTAGSYAANVLSPLAYSTSVGDPVKAELAKMQYGFGMPSKKWQGVDLTMEKHQNGQDAYDRFQQLHSEVTMGGRTLPQALEKLISGDRYQNLPQPESEGDTFNPRIRAIQSVIGAYREKALSTLLKERPELARKALALRQQASMPQTSDVLELLKQ